MWGIPLYTNILSSKPKFDERLGRWNLIYTASLEKNGRHLGKEWERFKFDNIIMKVSNREISFKYNVTEGRNQEVPKHLCQ